MAANKIILKIEEEGIREAAEIVDAAKKKAAASTEKITAAAKVKIEEINAQAAADADEAARRQILIAELEARKNHRRDAGGQVGAAHYLHRREVR